jgi:hypothetical protein
MIYGRDGQVERYYCVGEKILVRLKYVDLKMGFASVWCVDVGRKRMHWDVLSMRRITTRVWV